MIDPSIEELAVRLSRQCQTDGLNSVASIVVLRKAFGLSLVKAKEIVLKAADGLSLDERQATLVTPLMDAMAQLENDREGL